MAHYIINLRKTSLLNNNSFSRFIRQINKIREYLVSTVRQSQINFWDTDVFSFRERFHGWWSQIITLFLSLLTDYFPILLFASVLVTTGRIRQSLNMLSCRDVLPVLDESIDEL